MDTIINITTPLILTGLGFVTYKHPALARQILRILLYSSLATYFLTMAFYVGRLNALSEIQLPFIKDKSSIDKTFQAVQAYNDTLFKSIFIYFGLTLATIFIFYLLSGMFDNLRNPDRKKNNESPSKTTL